MLNKKFTDSQDVQNISLAYKFPKSLMLFPSNVLRMETTLKKIFSLIYIVTYFPQFIDEPNTLI